jgi:hypothetical protein
MHADTHNALCRIGFRTGGVLLSFFHADLAGNANVQLSRELIEQKPYLDVVYRTYTANWCRRATKTNGLRRKIRHASQAQFSPQKISM